MDRKYTFLSVGVIFWLVAAIIMHVLVPRVFDGGSVHIAFWVINFFFPLLALPLLAKATGRSRHEMLIPTVLLALPAMTLDSLAITFDTLGHTHIYANTPALSGFTGGFLLFAFASFFFWALIWHQD